MLRNIAIGFILGALATYTSTSFIEWYASRQRKRGDGEASRQFALRPIELRSEEVVHGVVGLVGNTPLVRISSLSDALGVEILGKAEYLNPGGSVKDRVALRMIDDAEHQGLLYPNTGSRIFEGTVGSTGISLATIARARGYETTIVIPDDVATEKAKALLALGATLERVKPASIVDKKQYVNVARERARDFGQAALVESLESSISSISGVESSSGSLVITTEATEAEARDAGRDLRMKPRGFFTDQFENLSNFAAHFEGTGPEIWRQTNGRVDAFVSGAGTGGTIAGIGQYLKNSNADLKVVLADPEGSGLYNKIKYGVLFDSREKEGTKRRHQVDTVVEGIGINRLTKNLDMALPIIDDAFRISDAEAVSMSRFLVLRDGLFLGSSSACNLFAAVKYIRKMGWKNKKVVVTVLCDSGNRHYSKFWNDDYLDKAGIPIDTGIVESWLKPDGEI